MSEINTERPINNAALKDVLRNYFLSQEPQKPLVILSKPFSGRTETIQAIMKDLEINPRSCLNFSTRHCPCLHSEYVQERKDGTWVKMSFDEWLQPYLEQRNYTNYKYCIIEIEPNEFLDVDYDELWGNPCFGYKGLGIGYLTALRSDKFELIAYYPTVGDWIDWAKANSYNENTIEFASENPEFYDSVSYRVYDAFEMKWRRAFDPKYPTVTAKGCFDIQYYICGIGGLIRGDLRSLLCKSVIAFLSKKGLQYR